MMGRRARGLMLSGQGAQGLIQFKVPPPPPPAGMGVCTHRHHYGISCYLPALQRFLEQCRVHKPLGGRCIAWTADLETPEQLLFASTTHSQFPRLKPSCQTRIPWS